MAAFPVQKRAVNTRAIVLFSTLTFALLVGLFFLPALFRELSVKLPDYISPAVSTSLQQNLSDSQRKWYYHADQGTRTFGIPYEWFIALEQPTMSLAQLPLFSDPDYLDRYGFIPDTVEPRAGSLPIGIAYGGSMLRASGELWLNPRTKKEMTGIGLTCAACHTGRFTYQQTAVIIDGGSALLDLFKLKQGLGLALLFTRYLPGRFHRFADRVIGPEASDADRGALMSQLEEALAHVKEMKDLEDRVAKDSLEEGYGRLDALNRIGNQVFSIDLKMPANYAGHSAPVHFPRIWNAHWFTWAQYNGSIEQPMVRNLGEALGVSADLNLVDEKRGLFSSSASIPELFKIEQTIAGNPPTVEAGFSGLKSPEWPKDILPPINVELAAKGALLYKDHCQSCHLPPTKTRDFFEAKRWLPPNPAGERFRDLELIDLQHIGTDPAQAEGMIKRRVDMPANLKIGSVEFGPALGSLVEKTLSYWYGQQQPQISADEQFRLNGNRRNGIQAPRAYKVRPLNGVWATPPYLHNGSVPNIYALLSPRAERPAKFFLGNREYDPVNLGYRSEEFINGFEFDTSLPGNSNAGHEFSERQGPGVIGPALAPEDRKAIIEFIKTL